MPIVVKHEMPLVEVYNVDPDDGGEVVLLVWDRDDGALAPRRVGLTPQQAQDVAKALLDEVDGAPYIPPHASQKHLWIVKTMKAPNGQTLSRARAADTHHSGASGSPAASADAHIFGEHAAPPFSACTQPVEQ